MIRCCTLGVLAVVLVLASCDGAGASRAPHVAPSASPRPVSANDQVPGLAVSAPNAAPAPAAPQGARLWMTVGERRLAITLADNAAARAFAAQLPLTLDMSELNGNEKHASVPNPLPANSSRPGTVRNGDLMLYGADTLVVFYATFESSYSYTRLGHVDDPADLPRLLGRQGITVAFSKD
jgi:hypothetical protein